MFLQLTGRQIREDEVSNVDRMTLRNVLYVSGQAAHVLIQYDIGLDLTVVAAVAAVLVVAGAWAFQTQP